MQPAKPSHLYFIRHAPGLDGGCLAGRRDVPADVSDRAAADHARALIGSVDRFVASPAQRCRMTAQAIWPEASPAHEPQLWEQDFGEWEGKPFADLPDPGTMSREGLAALRPPSGESFADLTARTAPAIEGIIAPGTTAVIAHAGTIRVALGLALGDPAAGLAFQIANWSVTALTRLPDGWAVGYVNRTGGQR
ncbi:histidine phosphatase family protein [Harenicola maris]|uniref:histidine phosphatase family protein n=1 Tax=Harenicola maris TaxID=2841044 RepID=UPI002E17DAA7